MNYFTSDLHLGHRNIIRLCNRPFATIEEMDETLIRNWNAKVTNGDTVYILGDLLFRNEKPAEEYLKQLKGKKHLIIGNHDRDWVKKCNLEDFFESVNNLHFISDGKRQMTLCHYQSMREWLGTSEVDLSVFDLQDLNFRLKKLPRIFRDLYEYDYPPTKHSIDLLDRKYCKTN